MAYRITSECINCGICRLDCDDNAIRKGLFIYEVVVEKCSNCGACADVCPTAACKPDWDELQVETIEADCRVG